MCFFKKKKMVEPINSKYQVGEYVNFRYKGEMSHGVIYNVNKDSEGNIIYSIQIGGECPAVIHDIREDTIHPRKTSERG